MYGGSGKPGRAGGSKGHSVKRSSFPPPQSNRPSAVRLSLGNPGGGRPGTNSGVARSANVSVDESFSLLPGRDPPAFAMIIRLTPDLVDEISRVEAQGGAARIKFDPNVNSTSGNVIGVGGKDFRFTWSSEMGDLCDIYEERQSGEDGNGLLFESGCAWRKLNVQRILDESTTNQVKMRSEEAERKQKSRKAIVLEPGNPSMKNQMKMVAAAESSSWKTPFKQKKEAAFKNRKFEPSQGAPAKPSVYISGMSSTSATKGRQSASPLPPSSPDQSVAPASPIVDGNITKSHAIVDEIIPTPVVIKEKIITYEDEIPSRAASRTHGTPVSKGKLGAASVDLQSMLISLLIENPKGMTLRALEKAIGDEIPNSIKKIEPIIKKIATFQTPGRYVLKPGNEMEGLKKPLSESGSSPEYNRHQRPAFVDGPDQIPFSEPSIVEKILNNEFQLNSKAGEERAMLEKNDIQLLPPNLLDDKRVTDNSRGQAASYSNTGSDRDSESDSSDSGSDSKNNSRSKSKSPVGSSSDSESDASANSKEGSDVDVDIMSSDDDKEPTYKIEIERIDDMPAEHENDERQHDHEFSALEIERILPHDQETEISALTKETEKPKPYSSTHGDYQERQNFIVSLFDENENSDKDGPRHKHSDSSERFSKNNSKRGFDMKHCDEKSENTKRLKAGSLPQPPTSGIKNARFPEGAHDASPDRIDGDTSNIHMIDSGYMVDSTQRFVDHDGAAKALDMADKLGKHSDALGYGPKYFERNSHTHGNVPMQEDKAYIETQGTYINTNNKKVPKKIKEASFSGKRVLPSDSQYKKPGEISNLNMESSPKDSDGNGMGRYPLVNGKSRLLQRELSDLELGELREPVPEETPGARKQVERKKYSKQSEGKSKVTDTWWVSDTIKGRFGGKTAMDLEGPSSPSLRIGTVSNPEAISKKRTPENHVEDQTRLPHKGIYSQPQHLIRADDAEVGFRTDNLADVNSKFRPSESGTIQGIGLESYKESQKRVPNNEVKLHENKRGSRSKKENRAHPSIAVTDLTNGQKDATLLENNNYVQKRMESSSDENSCYSKYEKDEPELKGPIKDFSQYEEYVQEYRDKYESYCSLDKILEADRNQFLNMGKNLKFSKGRDIERYSNLVAQLKDSYHQYGPRNKRLKHIFVVLHEELKVLKQRIKDYALQYTKD